MQRSFSDLEYARKKKVTRRERFLDGIDAVVPWTALVAELEGFYPRSGKRGRPPIGLERMLRMYIAQQCFGLSDEGIKDAIYDSHAIRQFVGIDLGREDAPDATTLLKSRCLLERHGLTQSIFEVINTHLAEQGLMLREGTIVDATLIAAPPSTKNRDKARDPEMHQTKKGNQYYFGMKAHVGSDAHTGLVHSLKATAANVADVTQTHHLLHGEEQDVFGDSGYQGADKRPETRGVMVSWRIAMKRGQRRALTSSTLDRLRDATEKAKAKVRARGEHPLHVVKNLFGHRKVRYRGIAKNEAQLFALFGLANLVLAQRQMPALRGRTLS
ncbi:IS5 family transposase [Alkalilimnicola ehrlichii]|uniref:IS5 family transposase n=1 Tax=Alkalilimnicola ehrlichii TaxID=351052 RepID=UPI003BA235FA